MDSNRKGSIEFASRFESTIINSENEDLWVKNGSDFTSGLLNEWGKYIQAASGFADLKHLVRIADAENEAGPESGLFIK